MEKQREFEAARRRLLEEQREEMRQRQESFKASKQKVVDYIAQRLTGGGGRMNHCQWISSQGFAEVYER